MAQKYRARSSLKDTVGTTFRVRLNGGIVSVSHSPLDHDRDKAALPVVLPDVRQVARLPALVVL